MDGSPKLLRWWRLKGRQFQVGHEAFLVKLQQRQLWVQGSLPMVYSSHDFKRKSQSQRKSEEIPLTTTYFQPFWPIFGGRDPVKLVRKVLSSKDSWGTGITRGCLEIPKNFPVKALINLLWAGAWTSQGPLQSEQLHKYGNSDLLSGWKSLLACRCAICSAAGGEIHLVAEAQQKESQISSVFFQINGKWLGLALFIRSPPSLLPEIGCLRP